MRELFYLTVIIRFCSNTSCYFLVKHFWDQYVTVLSKNLKDASRLHCPDILWGIWENAYIRFLGSKVVDKEIYQWQYLLSVFFDIIFLSESQY